MPTKSARENNVRELKRLLRFYEQYQRERMPSLATIPKFYHSHFPGIQECCRFSGQALNVKCSCTPCRAEKARRASLLVYYRARAYRIQTWHTKLTASTRVAQQNIDDLRDIATNGHTVTYPQVFESKGSTSSIHDVRSFISLHLPGRGGTLRLDESLQQSHEQRTTLMHVVPILVDRSLEHPGWLTVAELRSWLESAAPKALYADDEAASKQYVAVFVETCLARILFFLDSVGRGRIRIKDFLNSTVFDECRPIFGLSAYLADPENQLDTSVAEIKLIEEEIKKAEEDEDDEEYEEDYPAVMIPSATDGKDTSWFSACHIVGCRNLFEELSSGKGYLTPDDLIEKYRTYLNEPFVDALFQRLPNQQMTYKEFLRFKMALENLGSAPAIRYFFRMLDWNDKGYLEPEDLYHFCRDYEHYYRGDSDNDDITQPADPALAVVQWCDMVFCNSLGKITCRDVMASTQPTVFLRALIDKRTFQEEFCFADGVEAKKLKQVVLKSIPNAW